MSAPHKGKRPRRNTSALAVKCGNNQIIYQDFLTAPADHATNDLSMPCHEQRRLAPSLGVRLSIEWLGVQIPKAAIYFEILIYTPANKVNSAKRCNLN